MQKNKRVLVHQKYNGHCGYCGKQIEYKDMQVDHMNAKANGGSDDLKNLMPACRRCNHYKRSQGIETFREYIMTLHERVARDYITKVGLDFGIVQIKQFDGVFYFERVEVQNAEN